MMCPKLSAEDALCAASVATLQMVRKVANNRNHDHGYLAKRGMRERWADTLHGMMGEIALAHALDLPWTPGGMNVSRGDVAHRIEVRATEHPNGHLLIYDDDDRDRVFVLMIGHYPVFRIAGGMIAADARNGGWWRPDSDPPCFWVPQASLLNVPELLAGFK